MNRQASPVAARAYKRLAGNWSADLHIAGRDVPTLCIDLSQGGARVASRLPLRVGQIFVLTIHDDEYGDVACVAQIRWVRDDLGEMGVEFSGVAAEAALRLSHMVTFPTTETHTWRPWNERVVSAVERLARRVLPAAIAPPSEVEVLRERLAELSAATRRTLH